MFLGSRVDDALSDYHRHLIDHGEPLAVDEVIERYRAGWSDKLDAEQERRGVVFDEFDGPTLLQVGAAALKVTFEKLVPQLGMPVAVRVQARPRAGVDCRGLPRPRNPVAPRSTGS